MLHNSIVAKRMITFSISVIAALSLFLAAGPIVSNQKAFAANLCGSDLGCGGASDYGCDGCGGISYPSPLSNFFGGEAFHFHHFHGGFGFHNFGGLRNFGGIRHFHTAR
jgi:hypothetical protein